MVAKKNDENVVDAEVVDADESTAVDNYRGGGDVNSRISGLNNTDGAFYSSIKNDSFSGKKKIASALASSTPLIDHLNEDIPLVDFIIQSVQIADEKTGELNIAPRITLIDENGNAYSATSIGVLSSVEQFVAVIGEPDTWEEPVVVRAVEERGRRGYRFMTLKLV